MKATFRLLNGREAEPGLPLALLREDRLREPSGSLEFAAETAPFLPSAGVVLNGQASAPAGHPVAGLAVRLGLAGTGTRLDKRLHAYGTREWSASTRSGGASGCRTRA